MKADRQDDSPQDPIRVDKTQLARLRQLGPLLEKLPKDCSTTLGSRTRTGTGPDNRTLTYAHYAGLVLLATLHPAIGSLRDIQRASQLKRVRQALTPPGAAPAPRASLGSLSESVRVFDPQLLQPIIAELAGRLPKSYHPGRQPPHQVPLELLRKAVIVDGSCLRGLSRIIEAASRPPASAKESGKAQWRMHMQFRPLANLPDPTHPAVLTPDRTGPDDDERAVLARHLEPGCVYIGDRGFEKYDLLNRITGAGSDYVIRVQQRSMRVIEARVLTPEAMAAGVVQDELVTAVRSHPSDAALTHTVRRVVIVPPAHTRSASRTGSASKPPAPDPIVLLTSLADVPAEVLGAVYRLRWMIETFFRFFKHVLGLHRLLSTRPEGVQIQVAMGIIAALLIALACGRPLGRTGTFALQMFLSGMADEDEALDLLSRDAREQARRKKP